MNPIWTEKENVLTSKHSLWFQEVPSPAIPSCYMFLRQEFTSSVSSLPLLFVLTKISDLARAVLELSILLPQTPELLGLQAYTTTLSMQYHLQQTEFSCGFFSLSLPHLSVFLLLLLCYLPFFLTLSLTTPKEPARGL